MHQSLDNDSAATGNQRSNERTTTTKKRPSVLVDYTKNKACVSSNGLSLTQSCGDLGRSSKEDDQSQHRLSLTNLERVFQITEGGLPAADTESNAAVSFRVRRRQSDRFRRVSAKSEGSSYENLRNSLRDLMSSEESDDESEPNNPPARRCHTADGIISSPTDDRRAQFAQMKRTLSSDPAQESSRHLRCHSARDLLTMLEESGPQAAQRRRGSSRQSFTSFSESTSDENTTDESSVTKCTRLYNLNNVEDETRRSLLAASRSQSSSALDPRTRRRRSKRRSHGILRNIIVIADELSLDDTTENTLNSSKSRGSVLAGARSQSSSVLVSSNDASNDDKEATVTRRRAQGRKSHGSMRNLIAGGNSTDEDSQASLHSSLVFTHPKSCRDLFAQGEAVPISNEAKTSRRKSFRQTNSSSGRRNLMSADDGGSKTNDMSHFVTGSRIRRLSSTRSSFRWDAGKAA
ncbi:expressed unknown protein [Seminavis robusta]|uniref:Uncharacterized protein n=1 Tax=Seminavis robusta TaxID=568900 RepID=A0A9N8H2F6_9STRA|nr:expressed unknown protein [Seminavis robusta]|eukprot:Sro64_g036210.1 n/a (462) ;mRNA; f:41977-43362